MPGIKPQKRMADNAAPGAAARRIAEEAIAGMRAFVYLLPVFSSPLLLSFQRFNDQERHPARPPNGSGNRRRSQMCRMMMATIRCGLMPVRRGRGMGVPLGARTSAPRMSTVSDSAARFLAHVRASHNAAILIVTHLLLRNSSLGLC